MRDSFLRDSVIEQVCHEMLPPDTFSSICAPNEPPFQWCIGVESLDRLMVSSIVNLQCTHPDHRLQRKIPMVRNSILRMRL